MEWEEIDRVRWSRHNVGPVSAYVPHAYNAHQYIIVGRENRAFKHLIIEANKGMVVAIMDCR